MARFASFNQATRAQTPNYIAAAQLDAENARERYDRGMELATEGIDAYGKWAGGRTPIRDAAKAGMSKTAEALRRFRGTPDASAPMVPGAITPDVGAPVMGTAADTAVGTATDTAVDTATATATDAAADTATDAALSGVPLASALRGSTQLAQGDVPGALGTAGKAALMTTGPAGWATAAGLGLMGV